MRVKSLADIIYDTQILCVFCALGLAILWGLEVEGTYEIYALVLAASFTTITLCGKYLEQGKKP